VFAFPISGNAMSKVEKVSGGLPGSGPRGKEQGKNKCGRSNESWTS